MNIDHGTLYMYRLYGHNRIARGDRDRDRATLDFYLSQGMIAERDVLAIGALHA